MRKIKEALKLRYIVFGSVYAALMVALLIYQNCAPVGFVPVPQNGLNKVNSVPNPPADPICTPFQNGGGMGSSSNGIMSTITYLPPTSQIVSQGNITTASFLSGQPDVQVIPNPVYLNQFSIFTQNFTLGFQTANGGDIVDLNGNELTQYFSLQSQGFIGLASNAAAGATTPGTYQFAILSDDGAVFSVNSQTLINNDGAHSNRFSCAQTGVTLSAGSMIPFQLNYFQGPPVRIALMLFWRQVDPTNPSTMADPLCPTPQYGTTEGDTYFFTVDASTGLPDSTTNYDNTSAGSTTGILNRGWQVVQPGNFYLSQGTTNPCH